MPPFEREVGCEHQMELVVECQSRDNPTWGRILHNSSCFSSSSELIWSAFSASLLALSNLSASLSTSDLGRACLSGLNSGGFPFKALCLFDDRLNTTHANELTSTARRNETGAFVASPVSGVSIARWCLPAPERRAIQVPKRATAPS